MPDSEEDKEVQKGRAWIVKMLVKFIMFVFRAGPKPEKKDENIP